MKLFNVSTSLWSPSPILHCHEELCLILPVLSPNRRALVSASSQKAILVSTLTKAQGTAGRTWLATAEHTLLAADGSEDKKGWVEFTRRVI